MKKKTLKNSSESVFENIPVIGFQKLSLTENELSFHPENDKCEVVFPLDNVSISETDKVINLTAGLRFFSNEANSANRIDEYKEVLKSRNAHLRKTCKKLSMKK